MSNPSKEHFFGLDYVYGYLVNYPDLGLVYSTSTKEEGQSNLYTLTGYVDADWGGDLIARTSTSGYA
jgi:hypothetical protein